MQSRVSWETEFDTAGRGASVSEDWLNRLRDDQRGAGFAFQLLLVALVLFLSKSLRPQIFSEAGFYATIAGWIASIFIVKILADRRRGVAVRPVLFFAAWARGLVQIAGVVLTGGVRSPLLIALAATIFGFAVLGGRVRWYLANVAVLWLVLLLGLLLVDGADLFGEPTGWAVLGGYWIPAVVGAGLDRYLHAINLLALRDAVTGLPNHRYFQEMLRLLAARAERDQRSLSLLMVDIDDFAQYNDQNGYPAGDSLLRELGMLLASGSRPSDVVSRFGGEEFGLLFPDTPSDQAVLAAERLRQVIAETPFEHGPITVSIGVAALLEHVDLLESLVEAAGEALADAKRAGKDQVVVARLKRKSSASFPAVTWLP